VWGLRDFAAGARIGGGGVAGAERGGGIDADADYCDGDARVRGARAVERYGHRAGSRHIARRAGILAAGFRGVSASDGAGISEYMAAVKGLDAASAGNGLTSFWRW